MAFHWVKKLNTPYVEDPIFRRNFFTDFCRELGVPFTEEIDFRELILAIEKEKLEKENRSKEEKKKEREERKKLREKRKEKYGYAYVDGKKVEISNFIAEPSCIFVGRGKHPLRGRWKEGPRKSDIILNLSPDAPRLKGWKEIVWRPRKMWVASWIDKLSGKRKYVWLSDTWTKKQEREKKKFEKAKKLEKNITKVYEHIIKNLTSEDWERRKIALACLLIYEMNIRVGDEKDKDEADTVGCLTLRPEHILIASDRVIFDFLGKDSVHWHKEIILPGEGKRLLEECLKRAGKEALFKGLNSKQVSKFLNEVQEGLTAKVFRTFRATNAVKEYFKSLDLERYKDSSLKEKRMIVKFGILQAARICNHKKAFPKNYGDRLAKKNKKLLKLIEKEDKILSGKSKGNLEKVREKIRTAKMEKEFFKATAEWNLNTSLRSYINPEVMKFYLDKINLPYEKIYSKALMKKFSWCLSNSNDKKLK